MNMSYAKLLIVGAALAGCQTTPTAPGASSTVAEVNRAAIQAPLINRSEVVAVVETFDSAVDLEQKAAHWGYTLKKKEALDGLGLFVLTFDCPPGVDPHVASVELERLTPQADVGANHRYELQATIEKSVQMPRIYANDLISWPEEGCPAQLKIGVIDGFVDVERFDKGDALIYSEDFIGERASSEVSVAHGSAIAELLVGPGRLHGAHLYTATVVGTDSEGKPFSGVEPMLRAINWMIEEDVDIINISLAGPYNRALERGIQRALAQGTIIVAAVGNSGADSVPQFPAALEGVIGATAVDARQNIYANAVRGAHVDVSAPGVDVWVGDVTKGRYVTGTSIAAPFVAALIAANPDLAAKDGTEPLEARLKTALLDIGDEGPDPVYGMGLVNAMRTCSK